VLKVEILSEEPFEWENLGDVAFAITEGDCSGDYDVLKSNKPITAKMAAKALQKQGSDPEFFRLDEKGNDVDGDDEGGDQE
jgi:hypothetical protein